jgi:uncharacterized protein (UPF0333 family)
MSKEYITGLIAVVVFVVASMKFLHWLTSERKLNKPECSQLHLHLSITTDYEAEDIIRALRATAESIRVGKYTVNNKGGTENSRYKIKWDLFESCEIPEETS